MQNSTKVMLVAVLLLIVIIAVVWDRQNEKIKEGQIHVPVRLPDELASGERETVPPLEQAVIEGGFGTGDPLPAPSARMTGGGFAAQEPSEPEPVVQAEAPAPEPAQRPLHKYKVEPGNSFWTIAQKFYGDGNKWRKVFEANKDKIPTAEGLRAGMTIVIPDLESDAGVGAAVSEAALVETGRKIHIVKRGETLSDIARQYYGNANYRPILDANADRIPDKNRLSIGVQLIIPDKRGE
ncbi:MAG: LysM peptidoglycan-binding domain-containing protein [Planctomycetota bacterium]